MAGRLGSELSELSSDEQCPNATEIRTNKRAGFGPTLVGSMEAATGFEPVNNGFADRCLSHLAMPPFPGEHSTTGFKVQDPISGFMPIG